MNRIINIGRYLILIIVIMIIIFPILWTVLSSFKLRIDLFTIPPVWFFKPTMQNYIAVFKNREVFKHAMNSLVIASSATAICVIVGSFAGYSLARFKLAGGNMLTFGLLFGRLIPQIAFVVPYFLILSKVGLFDNHFGIILTHMGFSLPFAILLLRSFFVGIPRELEEAALIDGCNQMSAFFRIVLPLAAPGIGTVAIFTFLYSWNEFLYAFMFSKINAVTLPVLAASFITPIGTLWGEVFAVSVIVMMPMIGLGIIVRKYFVKGLTMGSVKG